MRLFDRLSFGEGGFFIALSFIISNFAFHNKNSIK